MTEYSPVVFNWSSSEHTSSRLGKCRHCGEPTNLRDDAKKPAHKVCAELAAANRPVRRHPDRLLEVAS